MASCAKQDDETSAEDGPQTHVYPHNPDEFIDIHGSQSSSSLHTLAQDATFQSGNSEKQSATDCVETSNNNSNLVHSPVSTHGLKLPVQETEGAKSGVTVEYRENSDEDEYESAEEGDDHDYNSEDESDSFNPTEDLKLQGDTISVTDTENAFTANPNQTNDDGEADVSDNDDDSSPGDKDEATPDPLEVRRKFEETLTDEEKQERKGKSQKMKDEGNTKFRLCEYDEAIVCYTNALDICPLDCHKERSIMFSNRAACKMKQELYDEAITDSTSALELHPHYLKAVLRRAELYEKMEKLDEALKDYQKALELDPTQHSARASCLHLSEQIKDRNEKMKEEMIGKLKDLGNMVLRPFGLSTNNFNLQQDPDTGSYSVQFKQNPGNGS